MISTQSLLSYAATKYSSSTPSPNKKLDLSGLSSSIYIYQKLNKQGTLCHRGLNQYVPIGQGSYFKVFKLPVLITPRNSEKVLARKFKALLILPKPTKSDLQKNAVGLAIQEEVQNKFGKYRCRLTRTPREILPGIYLQRYYPLTLYSALQDAEVRDSLTLHDKLTLIIDVAEALGQLHEFDFCQRDVKPGNIFLRKMKGRYRAFLGDFNLAARLGEKRNPPGAPYSYWDTASNQKDGFPATVAVDLYGLAKTAAELFFPKQVNYTFDLTAWSRNSVAWRNGLIKEYAIEKLREADWKEYINPLENAVDPLREIKGWLSHGQIFSELLTEAKILKEIFNLVCSIVAKDAQFAADAPHPEPVAQAEKLFGSPSEYKKQLWNMRRQLESGLNINKWQPRRRACSQSTSPLSAPKNRIKLSSLPKTRNQDHQHRKKFKPT